MVAVNQIRDEYRLEATAVGVEKTTAAAEGLAAATDKVTASSEQQERKVISVQRALERFAASNDQAFRAQQQVERAQALVNRAFEQGLSGTYAYERATSVLIERQAALARVTAQAATANDNSTAKMRGAWSALSAQGAAQEKAYQAGEKLNAGWGRLSAQGAAQARTLQGLDAAQAASTKTTGLHAGAWQNLGFQVNDSLTMLASGSSAFQVLATQGGQVYQILDGPKGVTGGLKEVGNFLLGLLTPARILIGGLAGIGVTAIAAAMSWRSTQSEVQQALSGVGRAAGVTAGELEGIAVASAAASNTSVGAARSLALELAKTGKIARDNLAPIAALGKNFAATLGLDATEGSAQLARSFAEPGKGAEDLARRYGLLSDATVRYIQQLEDSNERGRAQRALIDALRPKLVNAAELTTGWAYAWDKVSTAARNAWDWIGKATDKAMGGTGGGSDEEVRKAIEDRLRYLQSAAGKAAGSRGGDLEQYNRTIADLQRRLTALDQSAAKTRASAQEAANNDLSLRAGLIARSIAPELQALDELRAKRKTLANDMANQGAGPGVKDQAVALARLDAQIRDFTEAGGALELQERKRAAASQIVLDALKARTPAEVGAIAARKALNDAEGTATFQAERSAQAERERTQAAAAAQKALDDQSGAVQRNAEGNNRVADAWRVSSEAGAMYAESVRKASEDVETRGLPADQKLARQQAYLREQLSEQIKERARAIAQKNQEVSVDENLARLVDKQVVSHEQAAQQRQRDLEVARLQGLAAVAEGEQRTALLRQVDELTSAYGRENSVRAERAAQGLIADQERELAQLRLEAELVGKSTIERERAVAVLRAQQELQRQGIALSSEKGQTYIDNAAMLSDIRTARTQFERLAQDVSSVVSGIFDDMFKAGNKGLAGFFDSFARGFARIGTRTLEQNLIAPLVTSAMGGGSGAAGANLIGGLDFGKIEKAVSEGSFSGIFDGISEWLKPGANSNGGAGGFASSKLGGGLLSAGVGASIGYQSQSPLVGALGGAASGFAMGGPVGGVVGGVAGLLGGLFGKSQAKKEAQKKLREQLEAYREAYRQAEPEIRKLQATFRGESLGTIGGQIQDAFTQAVQANKTASQAGDQPRADQIMRDFEAYAERLRWQFIMAFEGTLKEVSAGFGTSGPFAQANAAVAALGESLKAFVADATKLPEAEKNSARARAAAQEAALAALDPPKALSDTQARLAAIQGTASGLTMVLRDLGMSADAAAEAIRDRTTKAMAALRAEFSADLGAKINEAAGKSYLNDIADLVKERDALLADAKAIGADTAQVGRYFTLAAQKVVDGSELTGTAFADLVRQFPALKGAVVEFGQAVDTAAAKAEAAARALTYQDRAFAAGNDTSTLTGALAAQDRKAAQDRAAEAKAGGRAMADLEKALAAERTAIIRDFAAQAAEAEKAAAEAVQRRVLSAEDRLFAARNDASTLTGKLAEIDRQHAQERVEEAAAGGQAMAALERAQAAERLKIVREAGAAEAAARKQALAEAQTFLDGATKSIKTYLDGLKTGADTALSPGDRLAEAQKQFDAQLALARSGNRDAMGSITTYASNLLDAGRANYASGEGYQSILAAVQQSLGDLPSQVSAEQFIVDAIKAQTSDLSTAIAANSPSLIQQALSSEFDKLDTDGSGGLTEAEFLAGLGPLATAAEQAAARAYFAAIDEDGNGIIDRVELMRGQLKTALEANSPGAIELALRTNFDRLDTTANGLLDKDELLAGLGPLATAQQQADALVVFKRIDTNGDGQVSKLELVRAQLKAAIEANSPDLIQRALALDFGRLDINTRGALTIAEFKAGLGPLATQAEQDAAELLFRAIDANGDGLLDKTELMRGQLVAALASNSPANIATALNTNFSKLDTTMNGRLDKAEFLAGLGPLASKAEQQTALAVFRAIDADGDGQISKLELVRAQLASKLSSATEIASALNDNFKMLDKTSDKALDLAEFTAAIGPLATKADQQAAKAVFDSIDKDGDGLISKMELTRSDLETAIKANSASAIATALNANFDTLASKTGGGITKAQFDLSIAGLATKAEQAAAYKVFQAIDTDGNGIITKTEAVRAELLAQLKLNDPTKIASALSANFSTLTAATNGRLTSAQLLAGLGPLATKADQATALKVFQSIDADGNGIITKLEAVRGSIVSAVQANNAKAFATEIDKSFSDLDTRVDGLLDKAELAAAIKGLSTDAEVQRANAWLKAIDADGDGQISKLELIRARAQGIEAATGGTKTSVDTTNTSIKSGNTLANDMKTLLGAIRTLGTDQKTFLGLIKNYQASSDKNLALAKLSLDTLKTSSSTQSATLDALNKQFASSPFTAPNGVKLDNNMISALNKIVFNTANTVIGQKGGGAYAYATGGWVSGPGTGTSDSIGARLSNGEFVVNAASARMNAGLLEAMNDNRALMMPAMPIPVPVASSSGGDVAAELRALLAEVARLRAENRSGQEMQARVAKEGADRQVRATEGVREEAAQHRGDDNRRERKGAGVAGGRGAQAA